MIVTFLEMQGENMATPPSEGKLIYHITSIDNLPFILKYGLLSRELINKKNIGFTDVADPEILNRREQYTEALSQYVLFHFFAKNPFDGAVCDRYGSENMVIIAVRRSICDKRGYRVIPSHPLDSDMPNIYSYKDGFEKVRWDILDDQAHRDYHDQTVRKACMAECIVRDLVPVSDFAFIYVNNMKAKNQILKMDNSFTIKDKIKVVPGMFPVN